MYFRLFSFFFSFRIRYPQFSRFSLFVFFNFADLFDIYFISTSTSFHHKNRLITIYPKSYDKFTSTARKVGRSEFSCVFPSLSAFFFGVFFIVSPFTLQISRFRIFHSNVLFENVWASVSWAHSSSFTSAYLKTAMKKTLTKVIQERQQWSGNAHIRNPKKDCSQNI